MADTTKGPAFGVPLYEMPDNSWCTSLIGGQKHELPLVVFTVIEEIYRRGELFLLAVIVYRVINPLPSLVQHTLSILLNFFIAPFGEASADCQECLNQESSD